MIRAIFQKYNYVTAYGLWQYDYGQILRIEGLNLPATVQIHFSLQIDGEVITQIGTTQNGITEVKIPDSLLKGPVDVYDERQAYIIYAWIYQVDGNSGKTTYAIALPVARRAEPTDYNTDDEDVTRAFDQVVENVNSAVEKVETAAVQISADREQIHENTQQIDDLKKKL